MKSNEKMWWSCYSWKRKNAWFSWNSFIRWPFVVYCATIAFILIDFLFWNFIGFLLLLSSSFCHNFPIIEFSCFLFISLFDDSEFSLRDGKHLTTIRSVCSWKWKGIYVDYLGRAYCYWTEGTGSKKESHTATEIYLEERQYLFGSATGKH